ANLALLFSPLKISSAFKQQDDEKVIKNGQDAQRRAQGRLLKLSFGNDGNELKIVTVMGTYLRATIVFRKWRETFTHGACYEPPRVF
ncbi:MAG: hypothetical protein ACI9FG_000840, partial [Crocinitomicaceae bacterium]